MMKYLLIAAAILAFPAWAGDGHNHGDEGFVGAEAKSSFLLSETQIRNLDLQVFRVEDMEFFSSLSVPAVVKKQSLDAKRPMVQAFVMEGLDFSSIAVGQTAKVKLDAYPNKVFVGKVALVEPMMDGRSRLYSFWIDSKEVPLKSVGLKGEATVELGLEEVALGVPESAVNGSYGNFFVFVKNGNKFDKKEVFIGHKMGGFVEVVAGLKAGDDVVTQGSYQLQYVSGLAVEDDEHDHAEHEDEHQNGQAEEHDEHTDEHDGHEHHEDGGL